jgi:chromosome partitioning protein
MQKILAITNQKGGVGKTTSAINIAAGLARKGKRVVLVDLDPQANLTTGLGLAAAEQTIYGTLLGEYRLKAYPTSTEKLVVVAGSPALSGFEQVMGNTAGRELRLRQLLEPFAERCDFVLLDCPPASGLITLNAYVCAQELYIPLEAQLYGTDGLAMVVDLVARIKQQLNPALRIGGIFFTRYDKRKVLRRETADLVRTQHPDLVLNSCIRESIALGEAPHLGKDIFSYAPQSAGAADYEALVTEILSR